MSAEAVGIHATPETSKVGVWWHKLLWVDSQSAQEELWQKLDPNRVKGESSAAGMTREQDLDHVPNEERRSFLRWATLVGALTLIDATRLAGWVLKYGTTAGFSPIPGFDNPELALSVTGGRDAILNPSATPSPSPTRAPTEQFTSTSTETPTSTSTSTPEPTPTATEKPVLKPEGFILPKNLDGVVRFVPKGATEPLPWGILDENDLTILGDGTLLEYVARHRGNNQTIWVSGVVVAASDGTWTTDASDWKAGARRFNVLLQLNNNNWVVVQPIASPLNDGVSVFSDDNLTGARTGLGERLDITLADLSGQQVVVKVAVVSRDQATPEGIQKLKALLRGSGGEVVKGGVSSHIYKTGK